MKFQAMQGNLMKFSRGPYPIQSIQFSRTDLLFADIFAGGSKERSALLQLLGIRKLRITPQFTSPKLIAAMGAITSIEC